MTAKTKTIVATLMSKMAFATILVTLVATVLVAVALGLVFLAITLVALGELELKTHWHQKRPKGVDQKIIPDRELSRILVAECASRAPCKNGKPREVRSCT